MDSRSGVSEVPEQKIFFDCDFGCVVALSYLIGKFVDSFDETLVDSFDEGEQTLIRPDFEPSEDLEREEVERREETSERSEVEPREEVLFKGMSKS